MPKTILCICSGNYCRSPIAEGLLRREIASHGHASQIVVRSAGTTKYYEGQPPAPLVVQVVKERGGDTNLSASPPFTLLAPNLPGQPGTTTYTDTNAASSGPAVLPRRRGELTGHILASGVTSGHRTNPGQRLTVERSSGHARTSFLPGGGGAVKQDPG